MKIEELKRGLIVSCQATPEEPMHGPEFMARMALAAEMGGAVGVRVNTVVDIVAVKRLVRIPVIGIIKQVYPGSATYITPTMKEIRAVYETGAEIVAVDCSFRKRPDEMDLAVLIETAKRECHGLLFMADVMTFDEGVFAWRNGADIVASTLAGYPEDRSKSDVPIEFLPPSLELVGELVNAVEVPVIAEGRIWSAENAVKALKLGAHAAVIGASITRPQVITLKIVTEIEEYLKNV